jgi:hypothetical protein
MPPDGCQDRTAGAQSPTEISLRSDIRIRGDVSPWDRSIAGVDSRHRGDGERGNNQKS